MKNSFIFLLLFFISSFSGKLFAGNCSYDDALVYFSSPSVTLSTYNPQYYCSDILYLINSKKGNISLNEYNALYNEKVRKNVNYLRKIGITPNIFDDNIDDEDLENFETEEKTNTYIKILVDSVRAGENLYVIAPKIFEPDDELFENDKVGNIVNSEKNYKSCLKAKDLKPSENFLYSSDGIGYYQTVKAIPLALKPVVVSENTLYNIFNMKVATIEDNRVLGKGLRLVNFANTIFEKNNTASIEWKERICKANTLEEKIKRNSTCYLCPYIVMIFNEISHIFNYMYDTFKDIMLIFLVIFGSLFMVFEFFKGFSSLPFDADFSKYPKSIAKKLQVILIVCTIIWIPPKILFSWTIQPVLDLTLYISDTVMEVGNSDTTKYKCNGNTIVDEINKQHISENENMYVPPIVKQKQVSNLKLIEDTAILSKTTMGNIICFLSNTLEANGKQMTIGEVLVTSGDYNNRFLGFIFGIIIFGLYFLISIMISFYILDGLIKFLEIAVMWPVYVFGYAFPVVNKNFNVKNIIGTAKSFGLTMINLAVFSVFNSVLLNSFYFIGSRENLLTILNDAKEKNDINIILSNFPTDLFAITQFLFIVYCIYYIYSKLGDFAASYGGSMGNITIGNNIKNIINSSRGTLASVSRKFSFVKKSSGKNDSSKEKDNQDDTPKEPEKDNQKENANE